LIQNTNSSVPIISDVGTFLKSLGNTLTGGKKKKKDGKMKKALNLAQSAASAFAKPGTNTDII
jgi:hypothetical protein